MSVGLRTLVRSNPNMLILWYDTSILLMRTYPRKPTMEATIRELVDILLRWVHVIAGIMWIGNSLLFNWLDRNLKRDPDASDLSFGKIWLLHSGAFYEAEKKLLAPNQMPDQKIHWFMFQNLTTWVSGILMLILVYYMGGAAYMIDPNIAQISSTIAIAIGIATLVGGWLIYDLIWRTKLSTPLAFGLSFACLLVLCYGLTQVLSGRAAYIHIGAMLGTLMTGNVWFYVVPSQRELVAATMAGKPQDPALSHRAKQRSIHNNYMTFPVLFIMISNHYPSTYGHTLNWLILIVLMVGSALVRHFMNIRFSYGAWLRGAVAAGLLAVAVVFALLLRTNMVTQAATAVSFTEANTIIQSRCISCHSLTPSDPRFPAPPGGVMFNTPEQIQARIDKIRLQVLNRTMPLANKTNMTEAERLKLIQWIDQGAPLQ
jgi:uncharacterized membrane protein